MERPGGEGLDLRRKRLVGVDAILVGDRHTVDRVDLIIRGDLRLMDVVRLVMWSGAAGAAWAIVWGRPACADGRVNLSSVRRISFQSRQCRECAHPQTPWPFP